MKAAPIQKQSYRRSTKANELDSIDYTLIYENLKKKYAATKRPLKIDFRKLVKFHSGINRYSHLIHSYPAKLLVNIPFFFLRCNSIIKNKGVVLDPFCGSGTVLLESILKGHTAVGADANPLARLVASVKTTPVKAKKIAAAHQIIQRHVKNKKARGAIIPNTILNWDHWYSKKVQKQLSKISFAISRCEDQKIQRFLSVCFSHCIKKVSFADPAVSVPVKLNPEKFQKDTKRYLDTKRQLKKVKQSNPLELFNLSLDLNKKRMEALSKVKRLGKVRSVYKDAKNLANISDASVDLIITSPPYAAAQKYIRSSSLSIGWLNMCDSGGLREIEKQNIGREHYHKNEYCDLAKKYPGGATSLIKRIQKQNPLRAHIAGNYLEEMEAALKECHRVLKHDSCLILVVGDNMVCGHKFKTHAYLERICNALGFETELVLKDDIRSRGLITKRNATASIITVEWILVLRKKI